MGNYGGIQLPTITGGKMDSEKERRQILNYLALLDEKLRYMFQNIDIEENLSEDAKALFFQYGKDIQNVNKDSEGNFSMLRQTLNEISTIVADNKGTISVSKVGCTFTSAASASSVCLAESRLFLVPTLSFFIAPPPFL